MNSIYVALVVVVIMVVLSALFSGMEIAFLNKNRLRLEIDRKQSRMFDYIAGLFSRHQGEYISTILVGNNIALVIYSMCLSYVLREVAYSHGWVVVQEGSILLETIIPTIIIIFLGEYLPKSVFKSNPNFFYRYLSPVMYIFYIILYPIIRATTLLSYGLLKLVGRKTGGAEQQVVFDRSDLESLFDNSSSTESTTEADSDIKIFQNALDFADLRVRDAMVSRIDVEAVDIEDCTMEQLSKRFVETMYSRIFVWRDSIDNIIGYVNSKSLFDNPKSIDEALMKVDYVAETLPLQDLLTQFTKNKSNIAVVIDEFGGTAGIISLEDVLEQIFGEIEDEQADARCGHRTHRRSDRSVPGRRCHQGCLLLRPSGCQRLLHHDRSHLGFPGVRSGHSAGGGHRFHLRQEDAQADPLHHRHPGRLCCGCHLHRLRHSRH